MDMDIYYWKVWDVGIVKIKKKGNKSYFEGEGVLISGGEYIEWGLMFLYDIFWGKRREFCVFRVEISFLWGFGERWVILGGWGKWSGFCLVNWGWSVFKCIRIVWNGGKLFGDRGESILMVEYVIK